MELFENAKRLKNRLSFLVVAISLMLSLLISCSNETETEYNDINLISTDYNIKLAYSDQLHNLSDNAIFETKVKNMTVLVFLPTEDTDKGRDTDKLIFHNVGEVIKTTSSSNGSFNDFKLRLKVPLNSKKATLMFIANCDELSNNYNFKNKSLSQVSKMILFHTQNESGDFKWNMNNASTLVNETLPMWADKDVDLRAIGQSKKLNIELIRAVNRVDLKFGTQIDLTNNDITKPDTDKYQFRSVYVYHIPKKGLVAGIRNSITDNFQNIALPEEALETPYIIDLPSITSKPIEKMIYLPENRGQLNQKPRNEVTTFVIGIFNPKFNSTNNIRYFKVNRDNLVGNVEYNGDLNRNTRTVISVNQINGNGYRTPEEALKEEADLNTTFTVEDWTIKQILVDGTGGHSYFEWMQGNTFIVGPIRGDASEYKNLKVFNIGGITQISQPEGFQVFSSLEESNEYSIVVRAIATNSGSTPINTEASIVFNNITIPLSITQPPYREYTLSKVHQSEFVRNVEVIDGSITMKFSNIGSDPSKTETYVFSTSAINNPKDGLKLSGSFVDFAEGETKTFTMPVHGKPNKSGKYEFEVFASKLLDSSNILTQAKVTIDVNESGTGSYNDFNVLIIQNSSDEIFLDGRDVGSTGSYASENTTAIKFAIEKYSRENPKKASIKFIDASEVNSLSFERCDLVILAGILPGQIIQNYYQTLINKVKINKVFVIDASSIMDSRWGAQSINNNLLRYLFKNAGSHFVTYEKHTANNERTTLKHNIQDLLKNKNSLNSKSDNIIGLYHTKKTGKEQGPVYTNMKNYYPFSVTDREILDKTEALDNNNTILKSNDYGYILIPTYALSYGGYGTGLGFLYSEMRNKYSPDFPKNTELFYDIINYAITYLEN